MQKLVWQNANGVELDLTSGNYGITEWEGFSNASLNIQSQQVPFQDGGVFLDALIEQRELTITLAMQDNNNLELRYQLRRELISALNPKLGEGYLIYTNDYTSKRIKCVAQIPLFETHNSDTVGTPKASLSWTACEPYWEDTEDTEITIFNNRAMIQNNGDIACQVKMRSILTAESNKIIINNITNRKKIVIHPIQQEYSEIEINTNQGNKKLEMIEKAQNLISWNCSLNTIYYVKEIQKFIIAGNNGNIQLFDGKNWEFIPTTSANNYNAITESTNSEYKRIVIVGDNEVIVSEMSDISNWGGLEANGKYNDVCYCEKEGGFFLAVGDNGLVTKWKNGEELFDADFSDNITTKNLYGVISTGDILVAVGEDGVMFTSSNGESWDTYTETPTTEDIKSINYIQHEWILQTTNKLFSSIDFINWELYFESEENIRASFLGSEDGGLLCIAFSDEIKIWETPNWNDVNIPSNAQIKAISYANDLGIYVFVGENGLRLINTSNIPEEETWEDNTNRIEGDIKAITESEQNFFAVTEIGNIYRSSAINIDKWESVSEETEIEGLYDIIYCKKLKLLVAVGFGGQSVKEYIMTSDNEGETWVRQTEGSSQLRSIAFSEELEKFVVVGDNGIVKTSQDGINWETQATSGHSLVSVISAKGMFFAVGTDGYIMKSIDGSTWNALTNFDASFTDIIYSELYDEFIVVGSKIAKSKGGTEWNLFSTSNYFDTGAFSEEDCIFRLAGNKKIGTTINGDTWVWGYDYKYPNVTVNNIFCAFYSKLIKQFIYGGEDGALLYEIDRDRKNIIEKISKESDMNLNLNVGENIINITNNFGGNILITKLSYRQKYIGV